MSQRELTMDDNDDSVMRRTATGLPGAPCLKCGALAHNASNVLSDELVHPYAGCVAICIECSYAQVYTSDPLKFRELTEQEAATQSLRRAIAAVQRARANQPS